MIAPRSFRHLRPTDVARFAAVAGIVVLAGASRCKSNVVIGEDGFRIGITKPVASVTAPSQGSATGPVGVTLTRIGSFSGALMLTGTTNVQGVSIGSVTVPAGTNSPITVPMTITVLAGTAAGPVTIDIQASSGNFEDVADQATFTLLPAAAAYTLSRVQTTPFTAVAGLPTPDMVNINRTNFTGAVTVTATSDAGITITPSETPTPGNVTTLTVTVPGSVTAGTSHTITVRGVAAGLQDVLMSYAVVVQAPVNNTTFTFCPASGVPAWVAVQDGNGPWTQATGTNNAYAFPITARGGVAWTTLGTTNTLHVFYGTLSELQSQGAGLCGNTAAVKSVVGTVANVGTAASVQIGLGTAFALVTPPATAFTMGSVPPGTIDLIAATADGASPANGIKMLLQRNINPSGSLGVLDFAAAGFSAGSATLTLVNTLGQNISLKGQYQTSNAVLTKYYTDITAVPATSRQFFGVPPAQQVAGDLHYLSAQALVGSGPTALFRGAGVVFNAIGPQTLTFGSALSTVVVTKPPFVPAAPQPVLLRAPVTVQAEYNKLWQADYDQISSTGRFASVQATAAYIGASSTANVDLPDLSGVAGWSSTYGLVLGTPLTWRVTASSWSTGGLTFVQIINGATFTSATMAGSVTP